MNHNYIHFTRTFEQPYLRQPSELDKKEPAPPETQVFLPKYPPSNCFVSEDRNTLTLEFALAGFTSSKVHVTGGKNSINVRAAHSSDDIKQDLFLHRGISSKDINFSFNVDEAYDIKKGKAVYSNGLLTITIPKTKDNESFTLLG